jgi:hypothetical protein
MPNTGETISSMPCDPQALVSAAMRRGQELLCVPRAQRDVDWYVRAELLGDLPALGSAMIHAEQLAERDHNPC